MSARPDPKQVSWRFDSVVGKGGAPVVATPTGATLEEGVAIPELYQNKWNTDLCGCFNYPISCCSVFFCGSCAHMPVSAAPLCAH